MSLVAKFNCKIRLKADGRHNSRLFTERFAGNLDYPEDLSTSERVKFCTAGTRNKDANSSRFESLVKTDRLVSVNLTFLIEGGHRHELNGMQLIQLKGICHRLLPPLSSPKLISAYHKTLSISYLL
jgi:hypothetical protein